MRELVIRHSELLQRWLPVLVLPPILVIDGALAGSSSGISWLDSSNPWWSLPIAIVATTPLLAQRHLSFLQMMPLMVASVVLCLATFSPVNTVVIIPAWALFSLAKACGRREILTAAIGVIPAVAVATLPFGGSPAMLATKVALNIAICELALALGYAAKLAEERVRRAGERKVLDERLRIARDVHDVVAHSLVAINVQSGVAAHLLASDVEQAESALSEIRRTSAEALADLRATLGLLRDPDVAARFDVTREDAAPGDGAQVAVTQVDEIPGAEIVGAEIGGAEPSGGRDMSAIESLARALRRTGVAVTVDIDVADPVPPAVESAAYRIVQEALTNVMRHSEATRVSVVVRRDAGDLVLTVTNDGLATTKRAHAQGQSEGAGAGVRGMTERAQVLDGTATAGPHRDGWQVRATLPVGVAAPSGTS